MKENKKKKILLVALALLGITLISGLSYAIFNYAFTGGENSIKSGQITMSYTEPSNSYTVTGALPTSDEKEKVQEIILNLK